MNAPLRALAVTGMHRGENPQPGAAVVASVRRRFPGVRVIGLSYDPLESSLYGQMALMGKADAQAQGGQLDAAIETWKGLAAKSGEALPVDAILMELARAYVQKGNREEARKTFTELVDKHPQSPYTGEARAELENLKG